MWRLKKDSGFLTRLAAPIDRAALSALLASTWRRNGNQSLEDQAALLAEGFSAIAFAGAEAVGFLGVKLRAPAPRAAGAAPHSLPHVALERWADVQLVALETGLPGEELLRQLLRSVQPALSEAGCTGLVCLAPPGWLADGLSRAGASKTDEVLTYTHNSRRDPPAVVSPAQLWPARSADAQVILDINTQAFEPVWRYDDSVIMAWMVGADRAVIAEVDGFPAGFALTTDGLAGNYAHLIRVATHPAQRGRGIGRLLVTDAILHAHHIGAPGLALNTQASNAVSRRLYESLGFRPTGHALLVLVVYL